MATLWISVFEHAGEVALGDPLQEMTVAVSGSSVSSSAVVGSDRKRRRARLFSDTDCHVNWGAAPVATTSNFPVGAENPEYIDVEAGHLIAVLERV